jgi:peptidoglycan/xylan/chitin deacetylase (PgdA/CDA1 family)
MKLAHNIGNHKHPNYHTREQILACEEAIGFDGIYMNVYENQDVLKNKSGIMFVMGDFFGKDNQFDLQHVPALEQYCTLEQVQELCDKYAFDIGWHTWSHRDLTKLSKDEIMYEVTAPFPCRFFAYPYGTFNDLVVQCVKEAGYEKAYSVTQGTLNVNVPDYQFKIHRNYVPWV